MNYFDILIIIPLLWGGFKGFKKGLIVEVASLLALFLGVWGGVKFSSVSAHYLGEMFSISEKLMPLISFSLTFILIVILVFLLAKLIQKLAKAVALSTINKLAGMAFGVLKFTLIISIILTLVNNINSEIGFIEPEMEESSLLYKPVSSLAPAIIPGLENISLNKMIEDAARDEAIERLEATRDEE
ncbi:MAG: CvpA family protein [Flavobacteriales bacterium]|nr:CvpA family protein [Flavobacteriales bacterium]